MKRDDYFRHSQAKKTHDFSRVIDREKNSFLQDQIKEANKIEHEKRESSIRLNQIKHRLENEAISV